MRRTVTILSLKKALKFFPSPKRFTGNMRSDKIRCDITTQVCCHVLTLDENFKNLIFSRQISVCVKVRFAIASLQVLQRNFFVKGDPSTANVIFSDVLRNTSFYTTYCKNNAFLVNQMPKHGHLPSTPK